MGAPDGRKLPRARRRRKTVAAAAGLLYARRESREIIVPSPQDKAWSDGFAAGKRGRPQTASPYKKGAFMIAWQQGWQNGVKAKNDKQA